MNSAEAVQWAKYYDKNFPDLSGIIFKLDRAAETWGPGHWWHVTLIHTNEQHQVYQTEHQMFTEPTSSMDDDDSAEKWTMWYSSAGSVAYPIAGSIWWMNKYGAIVEVDRTDLPVTRIYL